MAGQARSLSTRHLYVVYANIVLYCICFMMQQPMLPYLTEKLGASTAQFAKMQSLFNGAQAIGGLLSGPVLDACGGKTLLLISYAASILSYGLTASATSLPVLYFSRLITVLQHAVLAARTIVAGSTSEADRAKHLGYVGMCIGIGMSCGPMIGGLMSEVSLQFSAWMATAGSLLSFLTVLLLLPSDAPHRGNTSGLRLADRSPEDDAAAAVWEAAATDASVLLDTAVTSSIAAGEKDADAEGREPGDKHTAGTQAPQAPAAAAAAAAGMPGLGQFLEVLRSPGVADLLAIKLVANLASSLFQSMFTVILKQQGMGPKHTGAAMSLVGIISIAVQALLVAPAIKHLGEKATLYYSCWGLLAGFMMLAAAKGFALIMVSLVPQCVAGVLIAAVSTARLTKMVPKGCSGTALSLDMGLWSLMRMAAPSLGAWLLSALGSPGIGGASALLMAGLLGCVQLGIVRC